MPAEKRQPKINRARRHFIGLGAATGARLAAVAVIAGSLLHTSKASALGVAWWKKGGGSGGGGGPTCFLRGTCITTIKGDISVEDLRIGDIVRTANGEQATIRWVGHRRFNRSGRSWQKTVMPVRIARHALDHNVPHKDLYLSPSHALLIDGAFIKASDLINGTSITQALPPGLETIEYFHIVLDRHDVVMAEGTPAETFLYTARNHESFANFAEFERLYPVDHLHDMVPYAALAASLSGRDHLRELLRLGHHCVFQAQAPAIDTWERIATRAEHAVCADGDGMID